MGDVIHFKGAKTHARLVLEAELDTEGMWGVG